MNHSVAVIGIGSPHGADTLGWDCIDQLQRCDVAADLIKCDIPVNLPRLMDGYEQVILVDAVQGDNPYGTLLLLNEQQLPDAELRLSTHGMGVVEGVRLANMLGSKPDKLCLVGVDVNLQVETRVPDAVLSNLIERVENLIKEGIENEMA